MIKKKKIIKMDEVVVKFAGDSGDGIQLTGSQFSDTSAFIGNILSTYPDYPSEIRAPQGTLDGVSGFQVQIGNKDIKTPGDKADVLVAMNPAALKANMKWTKPGATVIIDIDNFDSKNYKKAEFIQDPLNDGTLEGYNVVQAPISQLTRSVVADLGLSLKTADKIKNQFVAGILYWLFNRNLEIGETFIERRFKADEKLVEANIAVLRAGYNYAETLEAMSTTYMVHPSDDIKGSFRNITGNIALAWGLLAASEKSGRKLFLGSYPITPATEILQELATRKNLDVITFQAEDEIAGICSSIGASFAGRLGVTSTSGPGFSLKSEAIGLAVMTELPIVIVNVQRGGPATGLPTKTEQADLLQALYGRNGECPVIVLAADTPANCFKYAYEAARLSIEHMTPAILLSDGYLANGSELWQIPSVKDLPEIKPPLIEDNDPEYFPYRRDPEKLSRYWALPGQAGLRHRIGGLEKFNITGEASHDAFNHQVMIELRQKKVDLVVNYIPEQQIFGEKEADLLVIGWGGTFGALYTAVQDLRDQGHSVSLAHFTYINPLPGNTDDILKHAKKRIVCELNMGQFVMYLRSKFPDYDYLQYNKVQGEPFMIAELREKFHEILKK